MQNFLEILHGVEIFEGLDRPDLEQVALVCRERRLHRGEYLAKQGQSGDELYIITQGFVEVLLGESKSPGRVVVNLGVGQIIGEMSLLDRGPRSASVRAVEEPTIVQVIRRSDLETLFRNDYRLGYIIMRNLAADLSFKLRHRNLSSTAA